ncbi:MAG: RNA-guided endonuclease InsQ/TnpB family protein [Bacteroidales bacterium]
MNIICKKKQWDKEGKFKASIPMNQSYIATKGFEDIPSVFRLGQSVMVRKKFSNDLLDVLKGKRTLASFRSDIPMFFASQATTKHKDFLREVNGDFLIPIAGFNFFTYLGKNNQNGRSWIEKIKNGEAKFCDSSIQRKGKKLFLLMVVSFESDSSVCLDKDKVCGVDLGIAIPAVCATNFDEAREYIGDLNIIKRRYAFKKQRQSLQRALVDTKGGHGRKRKLQALDRLGKAESNFVKTLFHSYSKRIVDFSLKNDCGVIKMEDLSGIGDNLKVLSQNWGYFQLQSMVEYKAKQFNIQVVYVDPRNTSRTCSCCGHCDKDNRQKQASFKCVSCGTEMNADYNAAINTSKWETLSKKKNK